MRRKGWTSCRRAARFLRPNAAYGSRSYGMRPSLTPSPDWALDDPVARTHARRLKALASGYEPPIALLRVVTSCTKQRHFRVHVISVPDTRISFQTPTIYVLRNLWLSVWARQPRFHGSTYMAAPVFFSSARFIPILPKTFSRWYLSHHAVISASLDVSLDAMYPLT